MKHAILHAFAVSAAAMLALGINPTHAQTTAPGPYYATPSWDQTLPASTRFIVLSNMSSVAVLDRETGLVWQRAPSSAEPWSVASQLCFLATTGGRFGWRLPTVNEIASLFDPAAQAAKVSPPLPAGHPFTGVPTRGTYWTATPARFDGSHLTFGYFVDSVSGTVLITHGVLDDTDSLRFWCVRGGILSTPQQ
jgi:hypothetical protein